MASFIASVSTSLAVVDRQASAAGLTRRSTAATILTSKGEVAASLSLSSLPQSISPPDGNVAEFGGALASGYDAWGGIEYLLVGAPGSNSQSGRAFLYWRGSSFAAFALYQELSIPDQPPAPGERFGASVAVDGDLGTIIIGSPGWNSGKGGWYYWNQPRLATGRPMPGTPFAYSGPGSFGGIYRGWGRSVALNSYTNTEFICSNDFCLTRTAVSNFPGAATNSFNSFTDGVAAWTSGGIAAATYLENYQSVNLLRFSNRSGQYQYDRYPTIQGFDYDGVPAGVAVDLNRTLIGLNYGPGTPGKIRQFFFNSFNNSYYRAHAFNPAGMQDIQVPGASNSFGSTLVLDSGNLYVTDANAQPGSSAVYHFRLDAANTSYPDDDSWNQLGSLGSGGRSYGRALAAKFDFVAIGEPDTNRIVVATPDTTFVTNLYTTEIGSSDQRVTIQVTQDANASPPDVTWTPNCDDLRGVINPSLSWTACIDVKLNSPMIGLANVCFDNPDNLSTGRGVFKCDASMGGECPSGSAKVLSGKCCRQLQQVANPPPQPQNNPYCVYTDSFSSLGLVSPLDTDGDFRPDLQDNCPTVFNFSQQNTDGDGAGDACDNCPNAFNSNQLDWDNDGIGNACDPTPGVPSPAAVPVGPFTTATIGIGLLFVGLSRLIPRQRRRRSGRLQTNGRSMGTRSR